MSVVGSGHTKRLKERLDFLEKRVEQSDNQGNRTDSPR